MEKIEILVRKDLLELVCFLAKRNNISIVSTFDNNNGYFQVTIGCSHPLSLYYFSFAFGSFSHSFISN